MSNTRRSVCARRRRPARARGFFGQPVPSLDIPINATFAAGTQKVGGGPGPKVTLGHDLPHASGDRVGVDKALDRSTDQP
jgi:hypothetical protein